MKTILLILTLLALPVVSEINPIYYKKAQEKSPFHLIIGVTHVERGFCFFCSNQNITVSAVIQEIIKMPESGNLHWKKGDKISIQYKHARPMKGRTGPGPIPILQSGQSRDAFLYFDQKQNCFRPSAGGYSFEKLIPITK